MMSRVAVTLILFSLLCLLGGSSSNPQKSQRVAPDCDLEACNGPNCRCFQPGVVPGGFQPSEVPQLVMVTFDAAVTALDYRMFFEPMLSGRQNPNGCPISATFFASHEYTDYSIINEIYNRGHDVGLNSMTYNPRISYWETATEEVLRQEFTDERITVSTFANIAAEDIIGVRTPHLQINGDTTFNVLEQDGFYDQSWPTQTHVGQGLYPYTLDYKSYQDCNVGLCPNETHAGTWVVPIVDWIGSNGAFCPQVHQCVNDATTIEEIVDFMKTNFHRHYEGYREPFSFNVQGGWFQTDIKNFNATMDFMSYLISLTDVYVVGVSQVIKWMQDPKNIQGTGPLFQCTQRDVPCSPISCLLSHPETGAERYMMQCTGACPPNYPWLGNPLGE